VRIATLSRIGVITAGAYAVNAIHYGWSPLTKDWIDDFAAWGIAGALIILYWAGYRTLQQATRPVSLAVVVLPVIALLAISFVTIPFDSTDVFQYMSLGWAEAHYGLNPYTNVLRDIPGIERDPMSSAAWMESNKNPWLDLPMVYGFTFAAFIKAVAWLGQGNWWLTLALFKFVNVGAFGLTSALIWSLTRVLGQARPDIALYLFTWSPLILLHHIANAHNDLLMGALIVLSVWLLNGKGSIWAPAVLMMATMLKYAALPLLPLALIFIVRKEGWGRAMIGAVAAVLSGLLLSLPYWGSIGRFRFDLIFAQLSKTTAGSLYALVYYVYRATSLGSLETFGSMLKLVIWIVSLGFVTHAGLQFWKQKKPTLSSLIATCSVILFIVIFVASSQFYSWYIGMFLPLALLLDAQHWLRQLAVLLGGTHALSLTSLSRKGIGYFILTTGLALGALRRARNS